MNVNSWMALKSNHCYQRNDLWKAWCGNRTATRKSSVKRLYISAVGLDILWNLNKYYCFMVLRISFWWGLGALFQRG